MKQYWDSDELSDKGGIFQITSVDGVSDVKDDVPSCFCIDDGCQVRVQRSSVMRRVFPIHLEEVCAEILRDLVEVIGPIPKRGDIFLDPYSSFELLL